MAQEPVNVSTLPISSAHHEEHLVKQQQYETPNKLVTKEEHLVRDKHSGATDKVVTVDKQEKIRDKDYKKNKEHKKNKKMGTTKDVAEEPSKSHAVKEKLVGGIKETIGLVTHNETLKESGREQKREGDAEALAAGKGQKHYDPALARKGVGFQHKHMGPNPKKLTEGPCAGCQEGTCQVGHDYDAAICHSVTQGHADAGHVKSAGMGSIPKDLHGDGVCTSGACCNASGDQVIAGNNQRLVAPAQTCGVAHNTAYDAAACPSCEQRVGAVSVGNTHSDKDKERILAMERKKVDAEKAELKKAEKEQDKKEKHKH